MIAVLGKIEGIISKYYHSILVHHIVPSSIRLIGRCFTPHQDNEPKHTSANCKIASFVDQRKRVLESMT